MRLLYQNIDLGMIMNSGQDGPEVWASYSPNQNAQQFIPLWTFITDEENYDKNPPFLPDYLDDRNWFVIDDQNEKRAIYLPAVYADGTISWRWRNEAKDREKRRKKD
jgi:hypothetical protein